MEKILVVEDNQSYCNMIVDFLSQVGYEVYATHEGREALPMIHRIKPNLVLLDVMLTGMNGFEICKRIKSSPETENIAVILLTMLNDVEDRTHAINVGVDFFLSKPANYKELKRKIEYALQNKSRILNMESARAVCQTILKLMEYIAPGLHQHTLATRKYSIKTAQIMGLDEQMIAHVEMGATLHDLGKLLTDDEDHWHLAREVLLPLKMIEWIEPYLNFGLKEQDSLILNSVQMEEIKRVRIVWMANRFSELCAQTGDQEKALRALEKEITMRDENIIIFQSLEQVLKDEMFVRQFKPGEA